MNDATTAKNLLQRLCGLGALAMLSLLAACGGGSDLMSAAAETHTVSGTVSGLRQSSLGL